MSVTIYADEVVPWQLTLAVPGGALPESAVVGGYGRVIAPLNAWLTRRNLPRLAGDKRRIAYNAVRSAERQGLSINELADDPRFWMLMRDRDATLLSHRPPQRLTVYELAQTAAWKAFDDHGGDIDEWKARAGAATLQVCRSEQDRAEVETGAAWARRLQVPPYYLARMLKWRTRNEARADWRWQARTRPLHQNRETGEEDPDWNLRGPNPLMGAWNWARARMPMLKQMLYARDELEVRGAMGPWIADGPPSQEWFSLLRAICKPRNEVRPLGEVKWEEDRWLVLLATEKGMAEHGGLHGWLAAVAPNVLETIQHKDRRILPMYQMAFNGETQEAIAHFFGCPQQQVSRRLSWARSILADEFADFADLGETVCIGETEGGSILTARF